MAEAFRLDIAAPNLVNICIDEIRDGEKRGRMYDCYQHSAFYFVNEHQMLRRMGDLMNWLDYPQEAVRIRSFSKTERTGEKLQPVRPADRERIVQERGALGSFIIHVRYRQNATWQGRVIHIEDGVCEEFYSEIELLRFLDKEV